MTGKAEFRTMLEENDDSQGAEGVLRADKGQKESKQDNQSGTESVSSTVSINI